MSFKLVVLSMAIFLCAHCSSVDFKIVMTQQGPVKGYFNLETGVYEFYGIPYAHAPTKGNKFQAPLPPRTRPNKSVFEAKDKGIVCLQGVSPDINLKNKTMVEDCLIANIFVPDTEEQDLPVLVYVHGGGFQVGYGDIQKFTSLVKLHNIIVVNFNYRLGIIGNLCLGTESVPGNAGLKDQVALLRWVNKNIVYFGGDPNKVTLSGCSVGAVSVDILGLSKTTKGLFRNMIVSSGSSLDVFGVQLNPIENAMNHVKKLKIANSYHTIKSLETIFKSMPLKVLLSDVFDDQKNSVLVFSPCVERNDGNDNVLTDAPRNLLENNKFSKMPVLYTYTEMEGLMKIFLFNRWNRMIKESFSDFLPGDLQFQNDKEKEALAKVVKDFYFKNVSEKNESISFVKYFTDIMFVHGIFKTVDLRVASGQDNVYLLEYSYVDERSTSLPNTSLRGANHCSQVQAVADEDDHEFNEEYKNVKNIIREVWANFIKNSGQTPKGSTLPQWRAVGPNLGSFMKLGTHLELKATPDQFSNTSFNFWNNIYENYYRVPVPPIT